jgi:Xaa-Pro aminopeptidase
MVGGMEVSFVRGGGDSCELTIRERLVAGDVIAIEPGIEGLEGIGGMRFEDLLLIPDADDL